MMLSYRLLGYGTGTINGYTKSDFHDVEVKLIDKKQKATEVNLKITSFDNEAEVCRSNIVNHVVSLMLII